MEEYLDLVFDDQSEPDYVDGAVVERALPTPIHSQIQSLLTIFFAPLMSRFKLILMSELRVQIEPRRFRVVDFAVYCDARPEGRYATSPAFVVVEIISPDDRYGRLSPLGRTARLVDRSRIEAPLRILRCRVAAACRPSSGGVRF